MTTTRHGFVLPAIVGAIVGIIGTVAAFALLGTLTPSATSRQVMVHDMGQQVMPFELAGTTHIFEMTETGGIQDVVADHGTDAAKVQLIQQHLEHEATLFRAGNFSDPSSLHGSDMPGVRELAAGATQIDIEYSSLPSGARLTFTTHDLALVTALHRWFGAQLSDHGSDATYR